MVIPIDEEKGIIMVSYTDNKYADFWNNLRNTEGALEVNREIVRLLYQVFGSKIPMPHSTKIFYWSNGVGYWGVGANSSEVAKKVLNPFPNMYICGENYSDTNQQWMEGALETAEQVVDMIGPL
jgi:monoamine oxidase